MAEGLFILDIDADGSVAAHPQRTELPALVAPIPQEDQAAKFDTLRQHLIATGCMGVPNKGFEFDSSFLNPSTQGKFTRFVKLMRLTRDHDTAQPQRLPPVSVFGHADPTGNDDYNKELSGRRALAVYGLLIRDPDIWDALFLKTFGGDRWGMRSIRFMLSVIKGPDGQPFFTGEPDGDDPDLDAQTRQALDAYEDARNLPKSGFGPFPPPKTRKAMYLEYMDILCHDETGRGFQLDPVQHFIARQKDKKTHRGDVQGCGEFNPIFLLSKAEEDLFASSKNFDDARNELYAKDRRVIIYIFKHDTDVDIGKGFWPCPEAKSGAGECRKRFWSDSDARLKRGDDQREFKDKQDTMACRFYHGFAHNSPCETGGRLWIIRFRMDVRNTAQPVVLKNRRYVLIAGQTEEAAIIRGALDAKGELRIPVFDEKVIMTLKLDAFGDESQLNGASNTPAGATQATVAATPQTGGPAPAPSSGFDSDKFPDEDKFLVMRLNAGALAAAQDDLGAKQRLYNLGFGAHKAENWKQDEQDRAVKAYRQSRKLGDGDLEATKDPVSTEHEKTDVPPPDPDAPGPVAGPNGGS